MKALYRRYRPKTLSEVVGQEQVTNVLANSLKQGKVSHAYLFIGPRGTGKTSVARIFAHEVNGFKYELEDDYVDIIEIDGASNRGIDDIRELREKVAIAPTSGKYKVYIIDEVHMLTKEAFNALLKTLEEPPEHVIFIMATTDAYKVPITITSRAQTYTFKLADKKVMFEYLKSVAEKEKFKITDEALEIITERGGGSFRDSMSLLDQISSLSEEEITKDLVIQAMGLIESEKIQEILDAYLEENVVKITTLLRELLNSGIKAETLVEEMVRKIIEEGKIELFGLLEKLTEVKAPFIEAKLTVALCKKQIEQTRTIKTSATFVAEQKIEQPETTAVKAKKNPVKTEVSSTNVGDKPTAKPVEKIEISKTAEIQETVEKTIRADFNWEEFLEKIKSKNDGIHMQLLKTEHRFINNSLHIYPGKSVVKTILGRDNNLRLLGEVSGVKITIHNADETPENEKKDEILTRISDIMGGEVGEVKNYGGGPF